MAEDEQRENSGERDKQAEEVADDRCQGGDGEHCEHSEHQPDKAAYLNGEETFLDIALKGEEHDVADEDQPAVGKTDDVQDRICDEDPAEKREAEIEQKFLADFFFHCKFSSCLFDFDIQFSV